MAEKAASRPTMAARVVAEMKRHSRGKIVRLRDIIGGRVVAEDLQKSVVTPQRLAGMHPTHAAYTYAQNQVSVMSEMVTALEAMAPVADLISEAEDLYMPSGPPMSPLTVSYFTCWAFFDASFGAADETIGTTILEVGAAWGMHGELLRLIRLMQRSRMGVYVHEGIDGGLAVLRDVATDAVHRCIVPAGYLGARGELWYARVLPPPLATDSTHVVFTTPYILLATRPAEWVDYFRRLLPAAPPQERIDAADRHMKYGPSRSNAANLSPAMIELSS
jgi:hypothetical protein